MQDESSRSAAEASARGSVEVDPGARRKPAARPKYTGRDVGSFFVILLGLGVMATALLLNPLSGRLIWGAYVVDKADVLTGYAICSLLLGAVVIYFGNRIGQRVDGAADGSSMLAIVVCLLLLSDRLLLVNFGLPLWIHDTELHYRHRPNAVRTLARAGRPHDLIRINSHGHHDTEFPRARPDREFRGLMVGDSITMGDQLVYAQSFSAQLEEQLEGLDSRFDRYQIINTGVHGYATYQEVEMLRESLDFDPDFIAVGFCLNDLTEPSVVARGFESADVDYHHVAPSANRLQGFFLNETGYGRLVQELRSRGKSRRAEERTELEDVMRISSAAPGDPRYAEVWRWVRRDLEEMARLSREADTPLLLMVFPFTFQLLDEQARVPQAQLTQIAQDLGIDVIDFTQTFADRIYHDSQADRELVSLLRSRGYSNARIERIFEAEVRRYFLDNDHLTEAGHAIVAAALRDYLVDSKLLRTSATRGSK